MYLRPVLTVELYAGSIKIFLYYQYRMQCTATVLVDHPSSGVVYNFGGVCLSLCNMITFESLDIGSSFLVLQYILMGYRSSLYMKVIGSRSRSQEQCKTLIGNNSGSITHTALKFVCRIGFLAMADQIL